MSAASDKGAEDLYAGLISLLKAGFTRDEAMRVILIEIARPPAFNYPPEFSEWMSKQSRVAERMLEDE